MNLIVWGVNENRNAEMCRDKIGFAFCYWSSVYIHCVRVTLLLSCLAFVDEEEETISGWQ